MKLDWAQLELEESRWPVPPETATVKLGPDRLDSDLQLLLRPWPGSCLWRTPFPDTGRSSSPQSQKPGWRQAPDFWWLIWNPKWVQSHTSNCASTQMTLIWWEGKRVTWPVQTRIVTSLSCMRLCAWCGFWTQTPWTAVLNGCERCGWWVCWVEGASADLDSGLGCWC